MNKTVVEYSHIELIIHEKLPFFTASALNKNRHQQSFFSKHLEITGSFDNLLDVSIHACPLSPTFISCKEIVIKTFSGESSIDFLFE